MKHRPILLMAAVLTIAVSLLYHWAPSLFFPDISFQSRDMIQLQGTVTGTDLHGENVYVYLRHVQAEQEMFSKALLILSGEEARSLELKAGYIISSKCIYWPFQSAGNYGNFEEQEYYLSQGIVLRAESRETVITERSVLVFHQAVNEFRTSLVHSIYEAVDDAETAGILAAICTGDRSGLTQETKEVYRKSGIIHILAVSGLHVSLIGMSVFRLLRRRFRFFPSSVVSMMLMISFCIMSEASASAVRATIMFLIRIIGIGLGKRVDILTSLAAAAILMILFRPAVILNSGFTLSFLAIIGAGTLYPSMTVWLDLPQGSGYQMKVSGEKPPENKWKKRLMESFLMSLSVNLVLIPVTASIYYEISLYSVFLNLLVIPLMSIVLGSGLACAILGLFRVILGRFLAGLGVYLVRFIQWACTVTDALPWSIIVTGHPEPWRLVLYYGVLLVLFAWIRLHECRKRRYGEKASADNTLSRFVSLTVLSVILLLILLFGKRPGRLRISFLDVGQGDGILLENPSGTVYLIDGGSSSVKQVGAYRMNGAIRYYGISRIDYVIITHPDLDHISGVMELMEKDEFTIGSLWIPEVRDNDNYMELCTLAAEKEIPVTSLHAGLRFSDGDLVMTCLYPDQSYIPESTNGYSAVMDIRYGSFAALMTGDLEADGESMLLQYDFSGLGFGLRREGYDVLKVAHHGSRFSSTQEFLEAVSPDLAVISAGRNNQYGHPHEETLERLQHTGARILITSECGEVILQAGLDGKIDVTTKNRLQTDE